MTLASVFHSATPDSTMRTALSKSSVARSYLWKIFHIRDEKVPGLFTGKIVSHTTEHSLRRQPDSAKRGLRGTAPIPRAVKRDEGLIRPAGSRTAGY